MPQLTLKANCIADVFMDDKGGRIVKINANEEDFFAMLDSVNPKNIIKYLDMRAIPHREAVKINVTRMDVEVKGGVRKYMKRILERNRKKVTRAQKLMEQYYG